MTEEGCEPTAYAVGLKQALEDGPAYAVAEPPCQGAKAMMAVMKRRTGVGGSVNDGMGGSNVAEKPGARQEGRGVFRDQKRPWRSKGGLEEQAPGSDAMIRADHSRAICPSPPEAGGERLDCCLQALFGKMSENAEQSLARAISGDTDALAGLLREHGPAVQSRLSIGPQWRSILEAEDVMQVTYLEAFMQIGRFDPKRSTFAGWLRHIAENNLRDAIRGLSRQKQPQPGRRVQTAGAGGGRSGGVGEAGGDSFAGLLEMLGATSATPSRAAAQHETQALIEAAIAALPADYAAVVQLYDLQGNSIAEVAAAMKRSPGAVHMLRVRAHDRLRELLGRESLFFTHHA